MKNKPNDQLKPERSSMSLTESIVIGNASFVFAPDTQQLSLETNPSSKKEICPMSKSDAETLINWMQNIIQKMHT